MQLTELDRLCATEIMGWFDENNRWVTVLASTEEYKDSILHYHSCDWSPTTNIAQAWQVLEKFTVFSIKTQGSNEFKILCEVNSSSEFGSTAALAICKAALKAKGVSIE